MKSNVKRWKRFKNDMTWYSFIIVSLLVLLIFTYLPTMATVYFSFTNMGTYGTEYKMVGLKNYTVLLGSKSFLNAFKNTILLAVYSLVKIPLGFLLAYAINSLGRTPRQTFFRIMFYIPSIITGVSVILVFQYVLRGNGGLLNNLLSKLLRHEVTTGWLSDPAISHLGVTILNVWMEIGYFMLMCLASLQSIPTEIYDAAVVDGANGLQKMVYITIPQMKSCFSFLLVTCMIGGFARFTDLYIIGGSTTAGRPSGTLQSLLMYIYQYSFESPQYGLSSAGSVILSIITLIFTLVNVKLSGFLKEDNG
jgi:ABC-type sugar transport system permease subunit|nr:sugar ABC transporter permease [uncultured Acetatifactor sp.]